MSDRAYLTSPGGATPSQRLLSASELARLVPGRVLLDALALQRTRAERAAAALRATERELLFHYRTQIRRLERVRAFAAQRIAELQAGARQRFTNELACAPRALEGVAHDLPRAVVAYAVLAFAAPSTRARFVLHPDQRPDMAERVLDRGFVINDRGRPAEIEGLL